MSFGLNRALEGFYDLNWWEQARLMDLLSDEDTNNWAIREEFPQLSIFQVVQMREHFKTLYRMRENKLRLVVNQ